MDKFKQITPGEFDGMIRVMIAICIIMDIPPEVLISKKLDDQSILNYSKKLSYWAQQITASQKFNKVRENMQIDIEVEKIIKELNLGGSNGKK